VQEQVMTNLGRELHDNIGQLLRVALMQVDQQKLVNPGSGTLLQSASETLTNTIEEVRRLSKSLNSDLLEVQGLVNTVQNEVNRLQQLGKYQVTFKSDKEPALNKDQKVIVFRIFQEMLNNIMKHSSARNIDITVTAIGNFKMVVGDDGKGFDLDQMMRSAKGSGLKNMIKRAELAKMTCTIDTAINKGTIFTLQQISSQ
jgi:signal transduction histidine kinase